MDDPIGLRASANSLGVLVARMRGGWPGGLAGLSLLLAALLLLFSVSIPGFASGRTVQAFMYQIPLLGLLSLAMVVPLITGGLNLAIIATMNQCALLMAWVMSSTIPPDASGGTLVLGVLLALAAGLALSVVIGLVTGVLVAYTGVHPILVTLGTKSLIDGLSIFITRGNAISGIPGAYSAAGNATLLGIPMTFLALVAMAIIVGVILRRTPFGVSCAMIGSNIEATRYSAVDTKRVLVGVYLMSSVLCFVAAAAMLAIFNSASAAYAQSFLLITILAAVLGGVDPFGGFGKVSGLMLALAILQVVSSGFNQFGLSNYLTTAFWGLILIAVMTVQTIRPYLSAFWKPR
jgi:simple sugar transport system permease protein